MKKKLLGFRQILDWRDELTEHKDMTDIFKNEIFSDTIYVMTPNGKVVTLPRDATPIDFAYAVHSAVGNRCRGAKVDGQIVPLSTSLKNGQRVEILTIKEGAPSINWIHEGWVKSSKAITYIRRYIRNQNNEDFFEAGQEIFERELSKFPTLIRPKNDEIVSKLNHMNEKELIVALGKGEVAPAVLRETIAKLIEPVSTLREELTPGDLEKKLQEQQEKNNNKAKHKPGSVLVEGLNGIVSNLAKCCKPIPGDEIIGFITQGKGVAVHRSNCPEVKRQAKLFPYKVISVSWAGDSKTATFNTDLEVVANDRHGLLRDLTDLFASEKIHIVGLRTSCKNNRAIMGFTIQVLGTAFNFTWLIAKVFNISGVLEVNRR